MVTPSSDAETQAPLRTAWLNDLFRAIDAMDVSTFGAALTEDARFRLGNEAPVVGRELIEQYLVECYSLVERVDQEIVGVWAGTWDGGEVLSVETQISYVRKDGTRIPALPVTTTIRLAGDRICDFRVFMDVSPLFASW